MNQGQGVVKIDNIENFIGKTVDSKRRMFHHYPLSFKKINGEYFYVDKNDVMMPFDKKSEIPFDTVTKTPQRKPKDKGAR